MTMTFIATVEYINYEDKPTKRCIAVQATSYTNAMNAIEEAYGNDIEGIIDLHAISDMHVIHLGNAEDKITDLIIDRLCEENTF